MFHQVFICDTQDDVTSDQPEYDASAVQLGKVEDEKPGVELIEEETKNVELMNMDLEIKQIPIINTDQKMKLDIKSEPLTEEDQILPDLDPGESKKRLRREILKTERDIEKCYEERIAEKANRMSKKKRDYLNIDTKDVSLRLTTGEAIQTVYTSNNMNGNEFKEILNVLNSLKHDNIKNVEQIGKTENNVSQLQPNKESSFILRNDFVEEYITQDVTESDDNVSIASTSVKPEIDRDISPSFSPDEGADNCSDWEQEYLHPTDISFVKKFKDTTNLRMSSSVDEKISAKVENEIKKLTTVGDTIKINKHQICTNLELPKQFLFRTLQLKLVPINFQNYAKSITKKESQEMCSNTVSKVSPETTDVSSAEYEEIFSEDLLRCNKCDKYFTTKSKLSYHIKYSTCSGYRRERVFQCDLCGKLFNALEKLQGHKNSHINARPFKCSDCDKHFNCKKTRMMHHKKIHQNKKVQYLCCFCGITSRVLKHVLAHEEMHCLPEGTEIPKPFKCLKCGKGFISQFKLNHHKKEHRVKKCPKCSSELSTKYQLWKHLEDVHNIVSLHECNICGKTLNKHNLKSHIESHSNVLSFFCDICDKGFKKKHHLEQHMITHSDERPISCPECGESFKRKTHLKQHTASAHGKGNKRDKKKK